MVVWPFQRVCPAPNRLPLSFSPPPRRPRKRGASSSPASGPKSPSPTWPACAVRVSLRSGAAARPRSWSADRWASWPSSRTTWSCSPSSCRARSGNARWPESRPPRWACGTSRGPCSGSPAAWRPESSPSLQPGCVPGVLAAAPSSHRESVARARCLYLKPTLSFGASVGGSVAHVAGVANALARAGVAVRLVSAHEQPLIAPPCTQRVVSPRFLISFPFEVNPHRYQGVFLRAAREEARRSPPDFIYQRFALNDMSGALLRERLKVPLVLEFNGSEVWAQRHWGERLRFEALAERIERASLRHAELVVVVSQPLVEQAVGLGAARERVLFYPNGIDPLVFDPARFTAEEGRRARAELGVPADADLLTFVGTFGTWHGTDVLATAIRRLIDEDRAWLERRRVHFLYVGDGALAPRVRSILGGRSRPPLRHAGRDPAPGRDPAHARRLRHPALAARPEPRRHAFLRQPDEALRVHGHGQADRGLRPRPDRLGAEGAGGRASAPGPRRVGKDRAALLVEPGRVDALVAAIRRAVEMPETDARDARAGGPPPRPRLVHLGPERRSGPRPPARRSGSSARVPGERRPGADMTDGGDRPARSGQRPAAGPRFLGGGALRRGVRTGPVATASGWRLRPGPTRSSRASAASPGSRTGENGTCSRSAWEWEPTTWSGRKPRRGRSPGSTSRARRSPSRASASRSTACARACW